jgi:hypothetical protein
MTPINCSKDIIEIRNNTARNALSKVIMCFLESVIDAMAKA